MRRPDPDDEGKRAVIAALLARRHIEPERMRVVLLAAVTIACQPTLSPGRMPCGALYHARAARSQRANTLTRVVAARDACPAQVCVRRANRITVPTLGRLYKDRRATSPVVERRDVGQDT